ncbi:MAG TPA: phosphatidylglycerol lysyltransferase domain-containing protein [Caulobacteraceae bacterium]|jgi:phosphatidylglycerol lysyltransferase|nr:phosphatidylglycerol lysyltransferase domain-containing protein [Caulobacteraceae bacterium]
MRLPFPQFRAAVATVAPQLCAVLTMAAGIMLLISGATPSDQDRFLWLVEHIPPELVNLSHFVSSLLGLVLLLVAWGLKERLDAAWTTSIMASALAGVLALTKGLNWEETVALALLVALLYSQRKAFSRHAALSKMEITPGWILSALAVVGGAATLMVWAFRNVDFADEFFWKLLADNDASRALRAAVGAGVLLLAFGVWRLFSTAATPPVIGETDPDFARVRQILAEAEDCSPEANLALLGDKRFLFSESGETFLMFGVRGRSWIAMGPPVGKRSERQDLLWRFRELADAHAARPGIYNIGPDYLAELVEMGFNIQKIGEFAAVPLIDFSIAGRRREVLRRNWRKVKENGGSFEVVPPDHVKDILPELQRVSDSWMKDQPGGEKGFSLGGFVPRYLEEFPCACVRQNGKLVAFANLWPTPDKTSFSMDLMRYADDAPKNVMDYLFVELLLWGQAEGFTAFEFGVAPLAGLTDRPLAPIMSRLGRYVFDKGEEFYNFQGVRRYKDKYDPIWLPRYVAAPHKWALPILMADVGLLSSGGVAGLRRKKPETPPLLAAPEPRRLEPPKADPADQQSVDAAE